jgi:hypothetical protein
MSANPYVLAIFRWASSLVGIAYFAAYLRYIDFVWGPYSLQDRLWAKVVCYGLIAVLVVRLLGLGGWWLDRACSVANFVGASWLFRPTFPYMTVNEELYLALSFWCCFLQLNTVWSVGRWPPVTVVESQPGWPLVLLGVNIGAYFYTAGMDKWCDPCWSNGTGLYHVLLLPWMRGPGAEWMLECPGLLRVGNYASMLMEILILPLMLTRWTRPGAVVLLLAFFGGLVWPMRMDFIGEVGLCIALAVSALILRSPWPAPRRTIAKTCVKWVLTAGVTVCAAQVVLLAGSPWMWLNDLKAPVMYKATRLYRPWLKWANEHATFMVKKILFSRQHFVGIWAFRIEVELEDGRVIEPIQVFREDCSGGWQTQGIGAPRWFQGCMYDLNTTGPALARYSCELVAKDARPVKARLLLCPLVMPKEFAGDVRPWLEHNWNMALEYDPASGESKMGTRRQHPMFMP